MLKWVSVILSPGDSRKLSFGLAGLSSIYFKVVKQPLALLGVCSQGDLLSPILGITVYADIGSSVRKSESLKVFGEAGLMGS